MNSVKFGHLLLLAGFNNCHFETEFCRISASSPNFQCAVCDFKAYFTLKSTLSAFISALSKELIKHLHHCNKSILKKQLITILLHLKTCIRQLRSWSLWSREEFLVSSGICPRGSYCRAREYCWKELVRPDSCTKGIFIPLNSTSALLQVFWQAKFMSAVLAVF